MGSGNLSRWGRCYLGLAWDAIVVVDDGGGDGPFLDLNLTDSEKVKKKNPRIFGGD